jgi:hypothetical protein
MTQIGWIRADFLYILIRRNAYYQMIDNLRASIKSALSERQMTYETAPIAIPADFRMGVSQKPHPIVIAKAKPEAIQ